MDFPACVNIENEWDIVTARQKGRELAKQIGFGTVDQARVATAISELARNIFLYAGQGTICFEVIETAHLKRGLSIVSFDKGPGIKDISRVMEDGYTTSGGLGAGLPGVRRLMDEFDVKSSNGTGTEVRAVKWLR